MQAPRDKLQQQARKLLLKLLHDWTAKGYDCSAIQSAVERVKLQLSTFEDKVRVSQHPTPTLVGYVYTPCHQ